MPFGSWDGTVLVAIMESTTGAPSVTFPISQTDITPYLNGLDHSNSIMRAHIATKAPVAGVAITARSAVVGGSNSSASVNEQGGATAPLFGFESHFKSMQSIPAVSSALDA